MGNAVKLAAEKGIAWAKLQTPAEVKKSPWFATLTPQQRDALLFSLSTNTTRHLLRDLSQTIDRVRVSTRSVEGFHIAPAVLPKQEMLIFPAKSDSPPRLMLGEEALLVNGSPLRPWT